MHTLVVDGDGMTLLGDQRLHPADSHGLHVVGTEVHALHALALLVMEKLSLGEVLLLFLRGAVSTAQSKSSLVTKSGRRIMEMK